MGSSPNEQTCLVRSGSLESRTPMINGLDLGQVCHTPMNVSSNDFCESHEQGWTLSCNELGELPNRMLFIYRNDIMLCPFPFPAPVMLASWSWDWAWKHGIWVVKIRRLHFPFAQKRKHGDQPMWWALMEPEKKHLGHLQFQGSQL